MLPSVLLHYVLPLCPMLPHHCSAPRTGGLVLFPACFRSFEENTSPSVPTISGWMMSSPHWLINCWLIDCLLWINTHAIARLRTCYINSHISFERLLLFPTNQFAHTHPRTHSPSPVSPRLELCPPPPIAAKDGFSVKEGSPYSGRWLWIGNINIITSW